MVQMRLFPPTGGQEKRDEERREEEKGEGEFRGGKETEGWPRGKKVDYGFRADRLNLL